MRTGSRPPRPRAFSGPAEFRAWLETHCAESSELFLRCAKVQAGGRGLTYRGALDEALCAGWIDGVRHALDEVSFSVRFTPRKPKSRWSTVNTRRFLELQAEGRVRPAGLRAFRDRVKSDYSFESRPRPLAPAFLRSFRSRPRAWSFFSAQPTWYRRTSSFWVMSAKKPETRKRRLAVLIAHSERHQGIPPLRPPPQAARRRRTEGRKA